ncbi:Phosphoglycerate mutase-like protein AT74H [Sesamum alatum]|uniref:Phosphoglycerate mutase-like protein AT74H n=1 Tax=Sesamum alatum TaxID=300844 RepID=A0AAE1Z2P0_9LAMI|nr:Phosphoglycerate mutase-like protein AT74H [Sesamum alatum]
MSISGEVLEQRWLPKRIILVRHGESMGNKDEGMYGILPDHSIPLSPQGMEQAKQAGILIRQLLDHDSTKWKVYIYVSPYERTRSTLREIGRAFPKNKVIGAREECRVREQDFGNFQDAKKMKQLKEIRNKFGRFFYRFPEGESGADVYDRVSNFLESLWRDIEMKRFPQEVGEEVNLVIVSHGLAIRIFLMRWFRWTVGQFELLKNPKNCEYRVMQLGGRGEYSLAIHHDHEKLKAWGLSEEMIADQKLRAWGPGHQNTQFEEQKKEEQDQCMWFDAFFYPQEENDEETTEDEEASSQL